MYYGNVFVGKLPEAKDLGRRTLRDVGTTYKLSHRDALRRLMRGRDVANGYEVIQVIPRFLPLPVTGIAMADRHLSLLPGKATRQTNVHSR